MFIIRSLGTMNWKYLKTEAKNVQIYLFSYIAIFKTNEIIIYYNIYRNSYFISLVLNSDKKESPIRRLTSYRNVKPPI
jgi:hypothetical protein